MARVAQYVIGAFEEDDYNHSLYDKVEKVVAKLDRNPAAKGFIGPQAPARLIRYISKKMLSCKCSAFVNGIILNGFLWLKGFYTKNPHRAYQEWCKELNHARFSAEEIQEIYRVSALNNYEYDELGIKAWNMLKINLH